MKPLPTSQQRLQVQDARFALRPEIFLITLVSFLKSSLRSFTAQSVIRNVRLMGAHVKRIYPLATLYLGPRLRAVQKGSAESHGHCRPPLAEVRSLARIETSAEERGDVGWFGKGAGEVTPPRRCARLVCCTRGVHTTGLFVGGYQREEEEVGVRWEWGEGRARERSREHERRITSLCGCVCSVLYGLCALTSSRGESRTGRSRERSRTGIG